LTYYIYTLIDPIDKEIKYIGKTKNLKDRMLKHMTPYSLKDSWTAKNKWILWLKNQGLKPEIEILDEGNLDNIDSLEIYWIEQFKQWGFKLKNDTKGGQGCEYWTGKKIPEYSKLKTKMNNPLRKVVYEYEIGTDKLIKEYDSISDASRETGHKKETISHICSGGSISNKFNCYWRFKDNYFLYTARDLKHTEEDLIKMKINHPFRKIICQYDIGTDRLVGEYLSSHDAERMTGIGRGNITRCCKRIDNYNSVGGYYWRYRDDYFPYKENKVMVKDKKFYKVEKYDKNMRLVYVYDSTFQARKKGNGFRGIKLSSDKNLIYRDHYWKLIEKNK